MATSHRVLPLPGFMPTRRPPRPATKVSPTASNTPAWRKTRASPGRCWLHSFRPEPPSNAATPRSAVSTKTRPPATRGAVKPCALSFSRQISRPSCSASSSLPRVSKATRRPSLPTPAPKGPDTLARQSSLPAAASIVTTCPSELATVSRLPFALAYIGNSMAPTWAVQARRTPTSLGSGASSAGLNRGAVPEQASSTSASPTPSRRRSAKRRRRFTAPL